jgi:hypothetical protein
MKLAPQEAMNNATHFNARCHFDLIGPFPLSANKNKYILVMIDAFSSYVECVPTPNKEAATIYQAFLGGWVAQHSFCDCLNSDLGSKFHNGLFKELSAKIGFKHTFSSVAHPTSNGQVERANRSILSYMRKFITENGQWESMLAALKFALNSAPHATKRYSPFQILYGRQPNLAHMLHTPTHSYSEAVQRLVYMNKITQDICKCQDEAFVHQKREFDKRSHTRTFSAGDIVYVTRPHSGHLAQKFQPSFKGPFSVITQKSHNNYLLQDCVKANRIRSVHVNLIKHGTFREQLFDETVYTPLTDLEPPQQPAALLRTLTNLKSTRARNAHGQIYNDNDVLLRDPAAAAAAAAGNGPIQGQACQGQRHVHLPAAQIPLPPALQKEERPPLVVESTPESDDNEFENALERTIIQSSGEENETPPTRTPPPSPLRPRRRQTSQTPSPAAGASGARPRTRNQTNKDGNKLGKLHDQSFPRERKKYERKKK